MNYALVFTGTSNHVTVPALTGANALGLVCEFDIELDNYTTSLLFGNSLVNGDSSVRINSATSVAVRIGTNSARTVTLSAGSIPLATRLNFKLYKIAGPALEVRIDDVIKGTVAISAGEVTTAFTVNYIGASTSATAKFAGKMYRANLFGNDFLNTDEPTATTWGTGTLVGFPTDGTQWTAYGGGTAPTGTVTIGTITPNSTGASVPFTYSASDQTGFEYRIDGGTAVSGTTSPQVLTGLTPSNAYTIEIRAINASGVGSWSAVANFTTSAPAAQVPQGTVTIGAVTTTQTTASVPYTYSLSDQTGFEYRLNGGSAVTATASPQSLTGLTANTAYTIEIRAINATGAGTWSAVKNFTTAAVPVGTITSQPLTRNNGTSPGIVSLSHIDVRLQSTGALIVRKTGVSTNGSSVFNFSDAAITTGSTYIVSWLESGGEFGIAYNVVAS